MQLFVFTNGLLFAFTCAIASGFDQQASIKVHNGSLRITSPDGAELSFKGPDSSVIACVGPDVEVRNGVCVPKVDTASLLETRLAQLEAKMANAEKLKSDVADLKAELSGFQGALNDTSRSSKSGIINLKAALDGVQSTLSTTNKNSSTLQTDLTELKGALGVINSSTYDRPSDCQQIRDDSKLQPADAHFWIWPHGPFASGVYVYCDFEGKDGWTVVMGAANDVNNCEHIDGDCDPAANGHMTTSHAGDNGFYGRHRGKQTRGPSNAKFCCNSRVAVADQVSYHREFCGMTGGYNNAAVRFCVRSSWLAGVNLRELRLKSTHTSACGQPWGFVIRNAFAKNHEIYNKADDTLVGNNKYHVVDVSDAEGGLLYVGAETGCPGKVTWDYFAFRL